MQRMALCLAIALLLGQGVNPAHAAKLLAGVMLCPLEAHKQLHDLSKQARLDGGAEAETHNTSIGDAFKDIVNSKCIMTNGNIDVELTGNSYDGSDPLSEVVYDGQTLWVDSYELLAAH